VYVYKFYTMEQPPLFCFSKHESGIQHIQWLEDDSGFVSCGLDKKLYFWNLYRRDESQDIKRDAKPEPKWYFEHNKIMFTSSFAFKEETKGEHVVYATCSDKCIREIKGDLNAPDCPRANAVQIYSEFISYSQVLVGP